MTRHNPAAPDRAFQLGEWWMATNGMCGVFRQGTLTIPFGKAPTSGTDGLARILANPLDRPHDVRALAAFVSTPPCAKCGDSGSVQCSECSGSGRTGRICHYCTEAHDCICHYCDEGHVECECMRPHPVKILGVTVDARLLGGLLTLAAFDPARPVSMWVDREVKCLVLRQDDVCALLMPRLGDAVEEWQP